MPQDKPVEIWLRGRKLCECQSQSDNEVLSIFDQIVRKAGYTIIDNEQPDRIIKII